MCCVGVVGTAATLNPKLELTQWLESPHGPMLIPMSHPATSHLSLTVTEGHGEVEIRKHPNCSHCTSKDCQWQAELQMAECICPEGMELAADNVTCMGMSCLCPRSDCWVTYRLVGAEGHWERQCKGLLCARHSMEFQVEDWKCIRAHSTVKNM